MDWTGRLDWVGGKVRYLVMSVLVFIRVVGHMHCTITASCR